MYLLIVFLLFFESFATGIPILNYSDKLAVGIVVVYLGFLLIEKNFWKRVLAIIESRQFLCFLLLVLVSILSILLSKVGLTKDNFTALKTLFFCCLFYTVFIFIGYDYQKVNKIVWCLILLGFFTGILSFLTFYYPNVILNILKYVFPESSFDFYNEEILRGRIAPIGALMGIYLLPLAFIENKKKFKNIFLLAIFFLESIAILLHNYRGDVIAMYFGYIVLVLVLVLRSRNKFYYLKYAMFSFLLVFLVGINLPIAKRFLLEDDYDIQTIDSRKQYAAVALDLFRSENAIGVGYGNYQKLANPLVVSADSTGLKKILTPVYLPGSPHNQLLSWLSETGLLGTIIFLGLLFIFLQTDFNYIKSSKNLELTMLILIISSWVLIVVSLLNAMAINLFYMFYIIRGIIFGVELSGNNVMALKNK